jgi:hypothetical protein
MVVRAFFMSENNQLTEDDLESLMPFLETVLEIFEASQIKDNDENIER